MGNTMLPFLGTLGIKKEGTGGRQIGDVTGRKRRQRRETERKRAGRRERCAGEVAGCGRQKKG